MAKPIGIRNFYPINLDKVMRISGQQNYGLEYYNLEPKWRQITDGLQ